MYRKSPMEIAHYDRLRSVAGSDAPNYLVVFQMPEDENEWVHFTPEELILRRCLRWISLRGAAPVSQGSTTVYLPESHHLTPESLRRLATTRSREQWINYDASGKPHAEHT
jgi:hypothetical protein